MNELFPSLPLGLRQGMRFLMLGSLCMLAFIPCARGADAAARVWTRADGVVVTAVFQTVHGQVVALKEPAGRNVFWNWSQLSAADRRYLAHAHGIDLDPMPALNAVEARRHAVAMRLAALARGPRLAAENGIKESASPGATHAGD